MFYITDHDTLDNPVTLRCLDFVFNLSSKKDGRCWGETTLHRFSFKLKVQGCVFFFF